MRRQYSAPAGRAKAHAEQSTASPHARSRAPCPRGRIARPDRVGTARHALPQTRAASGAFAHPTHRASRVAHCYTPGKTSPEGIPMPNWRIGTAAALTVAALGPAFAHAQQIDILMALPAATLTF